MSQPTQPTYTNRLIESTSPYLLQHAHNPVDWQPWGPEAFAQARERGVPILLSIGYSTCYWCHVMERESFEDEATAREMNASFVCIKVDREERPDVDELAMTATQIMTSSGGWPLNVFLEPDQLRPFWCGTYFPGTPAHGRPSFRQVLEGMRTAWTNQREEVLEQAASLADAVGEVLGPRDAPVRLGAHIIEQAVAELLRMHDRTHGGFGGAPKFPQPLALDLLLDARDVADEQTRSSIDATISHTLDRMALGGIHDHVGGGFHRYAVDAHWTVPHFEKMLYDNALLAATFTRAAFMYKREDWARVARRTLAFVRREMRAHGTPTAGFWSAQDAEVQGREGLNYLWTPDQVEAVLTNAGLGQHVAVVLDSYGLARGTNFQDPHHLGDDPSNVLRMDAMPDHDLQDILDAANAVLLTARDQREQPHTDDKVLAVWNGLMIDTMARFAATRPDDPDAVANRDAAGSAMAFLQRTLCTADGCLLRAARDGRAHTDAFLDDYGAVARAMIAVGEHAAAAALVIRAIEEFTERDAGGTITAIYDTRADQPDLFARTLSVQDGATPSGVGLLIHACIDLHEAGTAPQGQTAWLDIVAQLLHIVSGRVARSPAGSANTVRGLLRAMRSGVTLPDVPEQESDTPAADFTPIQVFASTDRVLLTEAAPAAEFELAFRIHPGYHLIAADPGATEANRPLVAGLVPFRVTVVGGTGVAVYADYPAGEAYDGLASKPASAPHAPERTVNVYAGEYQFTIAIERTGPITGTPIVVLAYQACTDRACLAPSAVELDVAIDAD